METVSGEVECPICFGEISLTDVMQNEIIQCGDCGADLEVTSIDPITLEEAPEEEEDWGE